MKGKSLEDAVPVTLPALLIFKEGIKKECNRFNKMLELCEKRILIAEKELKIK